MTLPSEKARMRWAYLRTISMSCSTKSTVTPALRTTCITRSMMANFSSALTPLVGSSSKRTLGFTTSAMAMSSSLRTPSGRTPAGESRWAARRKRASIVSAAASAPSGPEAPGPARRAIPVPTNKFS